MCYGLACCLFVGCLVSFSEPGSLGSVDPPTHDSILWKWEGSSWPGMMDGWAELGPADELLSVASDRPSYDWEAIPEVRGRSSAAEQCHEYTESEHESHITAAAEVLVPRPVEEKRRTLQFSQATSSPFALNAAFENTLARADGLRRNFVMPWERGTAGWVMGSSRAFDTLLPAVVPHVLRQVPEILPLLPLTDGRLIADGIRARDEHRRNFYRDRKSVV